MNAVKPFIQKFIDSFVFESKLYKSRKIDRIYIWMIFVSSVEDS